RVLGIPDARQLPKPPTGDVALLAADRVIELWQFEMDCVPQAQDVRGDRINFFEGVLMITKMSQTCRLAAVGVDGVNSGIEVLPIHRHQEGDDLANADRLRRSIGERLVLL